MARRAMHKDYRITCPALCELRRGVAILGFAAIRLKQKRGRGSTCWEGKCSQCGREVRLLIVKRDHKMEKLAAQRRQSDNDSTVAAVTG